MINRLFLTLRIRKYVFTLLVENKTLNMFEERSKTPALVNIKNMFSLLYFQNIPWSSSLGVETIQLLKHAQSISHFMRSFLTSLSEAEHGQHHGDSNNNLLVEHCIQLEQKKIFKEYNVKKESVPTLLITILQNSSCWVTRHCYGEFTERFLLYVYSVSSIVLSFIEMVTKN